LEPVLPPPLIFVARFCAEAFPAVDEVGGLRDRGAAAVFSPTAAEERDSPVTVGKDEESDEEHEVGGITATLREAPA